MKQRTADSGQRTGKANGNLHRAKEAKNDEFYTQLSDIENELKHYREHFKGKVVLCNCDDPEWSNFYYYFVTHFEHLGLKKLITTHFEQDKPSYALEYSTNGHIVGNNREEIVTQAIAGSLKTPLKQNYQQGSGQSLFDDEPQKSYSGDFRSPDCLALLDQADIVCTNPPFSLFREFIATLMQYNKKFIIMGIKTAITYKDVWKYIEINKLWIGVTPMSKDLYFNISNEFAGHLLETGKEGSNYVIINGEVKGRSAAIWYTNLDHKNRHEEIYLIETYTADKYPTYDNYSAIEVSKVKLIPKDYDGAMGVPISFLGKYNPDQFEIVSELAPRINGKAIFRRIIIKRKN